MRDELERSSQTSRTPRQCTPGKVLPDAMTKRFRTSTELKPKDRCAESINAFETRKVHW